MDQQTQSILNSGKSILLFDGVCNLCNSSVQFILLRDAKAQFHFAAIQSEVGQQLLKHFDLGKEELKSLVLIENGRAYLRSTAALRCARHLGSAWPLAYAFVIIPRPIRDAVYNWIASNRYRWFGRQESCMLPRPEWKGRFLG
ncbi:MAG: thiol-disulfide oxidoreductase DCC family protein [Bacteroidota bacterium]